MSDDQQIPHFDPVSFSVESYVKKVDKPWGYELHWVSEDAPYMGKIEHVNAGARMSLQVHDEKQESWLLISGRAAVIWENDKGEIVLTGIRSPTTKLWMVSLDKKVQNQLTNSSDASSTFHHRDSITQYKMNISASANQSRPQAELVAHYHAALGSPAISTLIPAIQKGFINIPGFTVRAIRKNLSNSIATSKGHLDQTRQGQHSTNKQSKPIPVLLHDENKEATTTGVSDREEEESTADRFPTHKSSSITHATLSATATHRIYTTTWSAQAAVQ